MRALGSSVDGLGQRRRTCLGTSADALAGQVTKTTNVHHDQSKSATMPRNESLRRYLTGDVETRGCSARRRRAGGAKPVPSARRCHFGDSAAAGTFTNCALPDPPDPSRSPSLWKSEELSPRVRVGHEATGREVRRCARPRRTPRHRQRSSSGSRSRVDEYGVPHLEGRRRWWGYPA